MRNCLEKQNFAIFGKDEFRLDNSLTRLFWFYNCQKNRRGFILNFQLEEKTLKPIQHSWVF